LNSECVAIKQLRPGTALEVSTRNTEYFLEVVDPKQLVVKVSGGWVDRLGIVSVKCYLLEETLRVGQSMNFVPIDSDNFKILGDKIRCTSMVHKIELVRVGLVFI